MHLTPRNRNTSLMAALLLAVASCVAVAGTSGAAETNGGWTIVDPADAGMDASALEAAYGEAFVAERNTQGVVVVRNGQLVSEHYAPGEGPRSWAGSWSMAKSITSILVGIAIDEGLIGGVDESMATWIPEWVGTDKAAITLRDVLQMQTGLESNEDYNPANAAESDVIQMGLAADQLAYSIARPLEVTPGTRFRYSSADTMLLSAVLEQATGMPADEYAQSRLFEPLGITQIEWWRDAAGHTLTYCCVDTTTRNFARFGLLYLNDGNWDGRQVVSADWVRDSLTPASASGGQYGYQWWIASSPDVEGPIYQMRGFDGQFVWVIPSLDMVLARNGDYTKSACAATADPNLFGLYPPLGLVDGAGTRPPADWDGERFLTNFTSAVDGPPPEAATFPGVEPDPGTRAPDGQAMVPCAGSDETTPPTDRPGDTGVSPEGSTAPAARPVAAQPTFTG